MKTSVKYVMSGVFMALFLLLIVLTKCVDVDSIGPNGTKVGFAGLNRAVAKSLVYNKTWYQITELLGYAALGCAGVFAVMGLIQLVQRHSLFKVDMNLLLAGGLYLIVISLYVFFNKVAVNYRPVLTPGEKELEASFPSSHTMLACVVFGSAFLLIPRYIRTDGLKWILFTILALAMMLTVVGRILAGVHWLTDIFGGVLISVSLLMLFSGLLDRFGTTLKNEGDIVEM